MKKKTIYVCDICYANYGNEKDACNCEESHRDFREFEIRSCSYDVKGKWGSELAMSRKVPSFIHISFSKEDSRDYGVYELKQYGPKGI